MEQTLGKRIMQHRKGLGLTQEQLAERLGVTPQAVSKWENDQSCPDIATLPILAEIFGVSIDALLGREPQPPVYQAEVVTDEPEDKDKGTWEFHWDAGRADAVAFAVFVLLTGALLAVSKYFSLDASLWDIAWPAFLLVIFGSKLLSKFSAFYTAGALVGGYYLLENLGIWKLENTDLIFPAIIVLFGISLLVDAIKKPKKSGFSLKKNGKNFNAGGNDYTNNFSCTDDSFSCESSFGETVKEVIVPRLAFGKASCSFGELTLDLRGCEEIAEGCRLDLDCSFGELNLLIPRKYKVISDGSTAFGDVTFRGEPEDAPAATVHLDANINFGNICIQYI